MAMPSRQAELLGSGVAQEDGHEVEEAVAQGVEHVIGGAGAAQDADGHAEGQEALQNTKGGQHAQAGSENAGDDADESVEGILFFLGSVIAAAGGDALDVAHAAHRVIDVGYVLADDYHVLSAGLDDGDNAVSALEDLGLCLALVLQFEAEPGDTVGQ